MDILPFIFPILPFFKDDHLKFEFFLFVQKKLLETIIENDVEENNWMKNMTIFYIVK